MEKAINLQRLSQEQADAANKKVQVLLGCYRETFKQFQGMDAETYYKEMLAQVGKELTSDGRIVDKEGKK